MAACDGRRDCTLRSITIVGSAVARWSGCTLCRLWRRCSRRSGIVGNGYRSEERVHGRGKQCAFVCPGNGNVRTSLRSGRRGKKSKRRPKEDAYSPDKCAMDSVSEFNFSFVGPIPRGPKSARHVTAEQKRCY